MAHNGKDYFEKGVTIVGIVGKKVLGFVIGSLLTEVILNAGNNVLNGKTITGKKKAKKQKDQTQTDWRGNIVLGTADYRIS